MRKRFHIHKSAVVLLMTLCMVLNLVPARGVAEATGGGSSQPSAEASVPNNAAERAVDNAGQSVGDGRQLNTTSVSGDCSSSGDPAASEAAGNQESGRSGKESQGEEAQFQTQSQASNNPTSAEGQSTEDDRQNGREHAVSTNTDKPSDSTATSPTDKDIPAKTSAMPAFDQEVNVDGTKVRVRAEEGTFPTDAQLNVTKVLGAESERAEAAVERKRESGKNVGASFTFDVCVLNKEGEELQPADGKKVEVSFARAEVANANLEPSVYHVHESKGGESTEAPVAERLDVRERDNTVTATTDGFSYYTVEFTYGELQYVMEGDATVPLANILQAVGLVGEPTDAVSHAPELFAARRDESGTWQVTALQPFQTTERLSVVIDGIAYDIVVTDDVTNANLTLNAGADQSGDGWSWNGTTRTLTLSGATINGYVVFGCDATIVLTKGTTSSIAGGTYYDNYIAGIYAGTATDGTTAHYGQHSLAIEGDGSLNVDCSGLTSGRDTFAINCGSLRIGRTNGSDAPQLKLVGAPATRHAYTVCTDRDIDVYGGVIDITAQCVGTSGTARYADAFFTQYGNLSIYGGYINAEVISGPTGTIGLNALNGSLNISGGIFSIVSNSSGGTAGQSLGINANYVTVTGGSMKIWCRGGSSLNCTIRSKRAPINIDTSTGMLAIENSKDVSSDNGKPANSFLTQNDASKPFVIGAETYAIRVQSAGGGTVWSSAATGGPNDVITLEATPANTYYFDHWQLPNGTTFTGNTYTVKKADTDASGVITISGHFNQLPLLTVTAKDQTITYGQSIATDASTYEVEGLVQGDVATVTLTADPASGTITPAVSVKRNGSDAIGAYRVQTNPGKLTVNKAPLTVTAASGSIVYGEAPKGFGVSYSGFVNGEDQSALTGTLSYDFTYAQYGNVGSYKITPKGLSSNNYAITYKQGDLTVGQRTAELAWTNDSFVYDGGEHAPTASVTNLVNNDGCNVTVEGAQTNVGTAYTARATGLSNGNYALPTAGTTHEFAITPRPMTVSSEGWTGAYDGQEHGITVNVSDPAQGAEVRYGLEEGSCTLASSPTLKGVGELTVYFEVVANNYVSASGSATVKVSPREVTVSGIGVKDKSYDGTTDAELVYDEVTIAGKVEGDDLSVSAVGSFTSKAAGASKEAAISGLTLGGADVGNYQLAGTGQQNSARAAISARPVRISGLSSKDKVYDGTTLAAVVGSPTTNDFVEGDDVDIAAGTAAFDTLHAGQDKAVEFSGFGLVGNDAANYVLAAQPASVRASITPKPVNLQWSQGPFVYNALGQGPEPTVAASDLVGNDECTVAGCLYEGVQGTAYVSTPTKPMFVGNYVAHAAQLSNADYTVSEGLSKQFAIQQKQAAVVAKDASKTYGDTDPDLLYTVDGLVGNDVLTGGLARESGEHVGLYDILVGTLGTKGVGVNYELQYTGAKLSIGKASLVVTALNKNIRYGDQPKDGGVSYSGFRRNDTADSLGGELSYDIDYSQYGAAGTYDIEPKGLVSNDYDISYEKGKLTVEPLPVEIAWQGDTFEYDGTQKEVSASVGNAQNGDELVVACDDGKAATEAGSYVVQATSVDGEKMANYSFSSSDPTSTHNWSIVQAQTNEASVSLEGWTYGKAANDPTCTASFGANTATYSYASDKEGPYEDEVPTSAGSYFVQASVPQTNNYVGATATTGFQIAKAPLSVTAADQTISANDTIETDESRYTVEGLVAGDAATVTLQESREDGTIVPEVTVTRGEQDVTSNYQVDAKVGSLSILPAGTVEGEVVVSAGAPAVTSKSIEDQAFIRALLTNEDARRVEDGESVRVWLQVEGRHESEIDAAELSALQTWLQTMNASAGAYMDISLYKQVGEDEPTKLSKTQQPVSLTVQVADALRNEGKPNDRTFYLVRVHDGKADSLANTSTNVLEGESDLFSTYVVAYADKPEKDTSDSSRDASERSASGERTGAVASQTARSTVSTSTARASTPKTADASLAVQVPLLAAGAFALSMGVRRRRR